MTSEEPGIGSLAALLKGRGHIQPASTESGEAEPLSQSTQATPALPEYALFPLSAGTPEAIADYVRNIEEKLRVLQADLAVATAERDAQKSRADDLAEDNTRLANLFAQSEAALIRSQESASQTIERAIAHLEGLRPGMVAVTPFDPQADPLVTPLAGLAPLFNQAKTSQSFFDRITGELGKFTHYVAAASEGKLTFETKITDIAMLPTVDVNSTYKKPTPARILTLAMMQPSTGKTLQTIYVALASDKIFTTTQSDVGQLQLNVYAISSEVSMLWKKHMRLTTRPAIEWMSPENKVLVLMESLGNSLSPLFKDLVEVQFPKALSNEQMVKAGEFLRASKMIP